jgi:hypothetical protein
VVANTHEMNLRFSRSNHNSNAGTSGQKTISFRKVGWHATWHGHLRKNNTPLNKWLKVQALGKIEHTSSCEADL